MQIEGRTALVTGANRGIGKAIVEALVERGIGKVYAGARNVDALSPLVEAHGAVIQPLKLDVTNADDVAAAASNASDTEILVNNAGVIMNMGHGPTQNLDGMRTEMEVNVFAPLALAAAFETPIVQSKGAIVNINSIASYFSFPPAATYSASKAASHSLTMGLRAHLGPQGVTVLGVYPGPIDTDMAADIEMDKASPQSVANSVLDSLAAGEEDNFPDTMAQDWHQAWSADAKALEHEMGAMLTGA